MFEPLVGILAASILLIATNAGLMGISRLSFSMGSHKQLPSFFTRIHYRFRTPYVSLFIFTVIAVLILIPGMFTEGFFVSLGALYTFGSLLAFILAHASVLSIRYRLPHLHRPFKIPWNLKVKGYEFPCPTILGFLATAIIWIVVITQQPFSRNMGFAWIAIGVVIFIVYRRKLKLPIIGKLKNEDQKEEGK
jgi:APA family basic amino acid/polyamine antiporter